MKHLHKFEAFIIPKSIRKHHPWWNDEDIALQVLQELKDIKKSNGNLEILRLGSERYKFELDEYDFEVKYYFSPTTSGGYMAGALFLDDKRLNTSTEVCKQIFDLVGDIQKIQDSPDDESKKSFRIRKGLI
jgi:hypothetical protein